MLKLKFLVIVSLLVLSSAAVAADVPFEVGKAYNVTGPSQLRGEMKVEKIVGDWLFIEGSACRYVEASKCWVNSSQIMSAVEI